MMADLRIFNLPQTPPANGGSDFDQLPAGDYEVVMVESSVGQTADGSNCLNYTLEVIQGEHKGRRIWEKFLLGHLNPIAAGIAQKKLFSLCRILGQPYPISDSSLLHNQPVVAVVKHSTGKDSTKVFANVDRFQPVGRTGGQPVSGQGGHAISRARIHENPASRRGAYPPSGLTRQSPMANQNYPQPPVGDVGISR